MEESVQQRTPSGPATGSPPSGGWSGYVAFSLLLAGMAALLVWQVVPEVLSGRLVETDSYMRLVRVQHLLDSGSWYDQAIPDSNAPFGEQLHWTRPLDLLILSVRAPLLLFGSGAEALHLSAVLLPPLLLLLLCFATSWAALPLTGRRVQLYVMISVLAQPALVGYGLPGRPDHHILIFLIFALVIGFSLRWLASPGSTRQALLAGLSTAGGLWVGPEFLLVWGLVLGAGYLLWVTKDGDYARGNTVFSLGVTAGLAIAMALEHPIGTWLQPEYDRVSAPHFLAAFIALAFWAGMHSLSGRDRSPGIASKLVWGGLALLVAWAGIRMTYPEFLAGPTVTIDPRLRPIWFSLLEERLSLVPPDGLAGLGNLIVFLGSSVASLAVALWFLKRAWRSRAGGPWLLMTVFLAVFLLAAASRIRFAPYPEVLAAIVTGVVLKELLSVLDSVRSDLNRALLRSLGAVVLITGFLFLGFALTAIGGRSASSVRAASLDAERTCPVSDVIGWLGQGDAFSGRPQTIAAHLDYGPEILYRTSHRVLGTPYHRNAEGILAGFGILGDPDLASSRAIVEERGVDLIMVCPLDDWIYDGSVQGAPPGPTLHSILSSGQVPDWLEPVPVPEVLVGDVLLLQVR